MAKRLMDYGFHAPTVSFPVAGTLMVEPTESEDQGRARSLLRRDDSDPAGDRGRGRPASADRERQRAQERAAHRGGGRCATDWTHPYSREQAAFPLPFVSERSSGRAVGRIDNPYGDRNLFCSCPPIEDI